MPHLNFDINLPAIFSIGAMIWALIRGISRRETELDGMKDEMRRMSDCLQRHLEEEQQTRERLASLEGYLKKSI